MEKKKLYLVCNAHLDPIYMWQLTEGTAEALSTFRIAARFCEEHEDFVFNHNEALLYEYVQQYEPELFAKIQKLQKEGKWHIMGGWYVQPDCNMSSGESLIHHIHTGKQFFRKYFDAEPTTAINFDPFGHSRGLVQLLKKSGYDSYLFCRPDQNQLPDLPDDFTWVGFDGSEILGHRSSEHYCTTIGTAAPEICQWLESQDKEKEHMFLWGVGNHGGGPSRADLDAIYELMDSCEDYEIVHSIPEIYCRNRLASPDFETQEKFSQWLSPVAPGGYTTMVRIKQGHRKLENAIFMAEKMLSHASAAGLLEYPQEQLTTAVKDLMLIEFHDSLPGSIIREAEEDVLRIIDHGIEIAQRLQLQAFLALMAGQKPMVMHQIPIFLYNPHPYPVTGIFECEYGLPRDTTLGAEDLKNNYLSMISENTVIFPTVYLNGERLPSQLEQHHSHKPFEWRKRSVFHVQLPPCSMTRLECKFTREPREKICTHPQPAGDVVVETPQLRVVIDRSTGLMTSYCAEGQEYLSGPAFRPLVMEDPYDAYGWSAAPFDHVLGSFALMDREQVRRFLGFPEADTEAVRIVEQGEVRTVVQVLLQYQGSQLILLYKIPHFGKRIEVESVVYWNEKARMLKLSLPTVLTRGDYLGEHPFGVQKMNQGHEEICAHKWAGLFEEDRALTWGCDSGYGSDCEDGEIRMTMLRSPMYLHGEFNRNMPWDYNRFDYRTDTGERCFRIWMEAGNAKERRENVSRESLTWNEAPYILSMNPSGAGVLPESFVAVEAPSVVVTAMKQAEDGKGGYILHLFESAGKCVETKVESPMFHSGKSLNFAPFELKTVRFKPENNAWLEEKEITI